MTGEDCRDAGKGSEHSRLTDLGAGIARMMLTYWSTG